MTCVNDLLIQDLENQLQALRTSPYKDAPAIQQEIRRLEGRLGTLKLQATVP